MCARTDVKTYLSGVCDCFIYAFGRRLRSRMDALFCWLAMRNVSNVWLQECFHWTCYSSSDICRELVSFSLRSRWVSILSSIRAFSLSHLRQQKHFRRGFSDALYVFVKFKMGWTGMSSRVMILERDVKHLVGWRHFCVAFCINVICEGFWAPRRRWNAQFCESCIVWFEICSVLFSHDVFSKCGLLCQAGGWIAWEGYYDGRSQSVDRRRLCFRCSSDASSEGWHGWQVNELAGDTELAVWGNHLMQCRSSASNWFRMRVLFCL